MNVRIISGLYGGRKLDAPDNNRTHPMSERVRNALFNSLGDQITDAEVLDAFAGTGALGLEALSRGAKYATFIEKDRLAQKILNKNIATLGVENTTKTIATTVLNWTKGYNGDGFDIIFADPPYHDPQFSTVSELFGLLKPGGTMILSHPGRGEEPTKNGVVVVDNRSYGNAFLTFYRRENV
ncbi:MAG TPA: 16S rRNA (guanine(966)-N(2))-methyltransferase RsmD [Candidatus Saccharimonadales bacterium]|nr:16S rRNA (guanine(966)-N(2))-methyltransferase RsmD [Candidatus Saccharimonadales bacterium]